MFIIIKTRKKVDNLSYIIMSHCLKQQNNGFNQISNEQELAKKGSNMNILVTNKKTKNIEVRNHHNLLSFSLGV